VGWTRELRLVEVVEILAPQLEAVRKGFPNIHQQEPV
jgi:hypothetical protein